MKFLIDFDPAKHQYDYLQSEYPNEFNWLNEHHWQYHTELDFVPDYNDELVILDENAQGQEIELVLKIKKRCIVIEQNERTNILFCDVDMSADD